MRTTMIVLIGAIMILSTATVELARRVQAEQKVEPKVDAREPDKVRDDDARQVSRRNLQDLATALHNYSDAHGRFPPAVVMGPDGKTPRSWRVEILPFIEGPRRGPGPAPRPYKSLYEQYKLNEPWDGPNNKKLLSKMPDEFRIPTDGEKSTNTAYVAIVGKGAIFGGTTGVRIRDIKDGSLRTILLVESNPVVPWTQPVDIAYDPTKPMPKLGGLYKDGFHAMDAAGIRYFIPQTIEDAHLRALITRDGGEEYDFPK